MPGDELFLNSPDGVRTKHNMLPDGGRSCIGQKNKCAGNVLLTQYVLRLLVRSVRRGKSSAPSAKSPRAFMWHSKLRLTRRLAAYLQLNQFNDVDPWVRLYLQHRIIWKSPLRQPCTLNFARFYPEFWSCIHPFCHGRRLGMSESGFVISLLSVCWQGRRTIKAMIPFPEC